MHGHTRAFVEGAAAATMTAIKEVGAAAIDSVATLRIDEDLAPKDHTREVEGVALTIVHSRRQTFGVP